jgi:hypothetical protein
MFRVSLEIKVVLGFIPLPIADRIFLLTKKKEVFSKVFNSIIRKSSKVSIYYYSIEVIITYKKLY